jgi:hypothetical protein
VRLLLKNIGKRMIEAKIREELEVLHINVQAVAVMQLRSKGRDQDLETDCPLTPHYNLSVARGPDMAKVRTLTDLCGLQTKVETYNAPKGHLKCKPCHRFCGYTRKCVVCVDAHTSGKCVTLKRQLKCCSCGRNHTELVSVSGKKQRRQWVRGRKVGTSTRLQATK